MRASNTYRAARRTEAKVTGEKMVPHASKVKHGKRMAWLIHHPKLAPFYSMSVRLLQNSDRAQKPTWRAIKKMMVLVATGPRIDMPGVGKRVPYMLGQASHERGSWRSYPHVVIDANLKVPA